MKKGHNISKFPVQKSNYINWESVFMNPAAIRLETFNTGMIVSKLSGLMNLNNKNASQLKDGLAEIPVLAHVIRHKKFGDYLIDSGFDSSFSYKTGGNFKGILKNFYFKNRYIQEKASDGIDFQLKERDIDLNGVFLTHFHEHMSGIPSLPNEIPYVFGTGEEEINKYPFVYSDFLKNKINLQRIDFQEGQEMPIWGKCIDVFGDGSFWAAATHGHTKGHVSYIINGEEAQTFIAGDACATKKGFDLGIETGKFSLNIEEGHKSFLKIKNFINLYPFVKIVFGHETDEYKIVYRAEE